MSGDGELRPEWMRDPAAFDCIYREHGPRLRAFLRQSVGSTEVAEDLMQEIFTELWSQVLGSKAMAFDPLRGSLRAYLFGMGRHRAADWWRGRKPEMVLSEDSRYGLEDPERHSVMGDALARLPEEQRLLLWLREVEGQSYAELAEILAIPLGTVRSRLFAAREALRAVWLSGTRKGELYEVR